MTLSIDGGMKDTIDMSDSTSSSLQTPPGPTVDLLDFDTARKQRVAPNQSNAEEAHGIRFSAEAYAQLQQIAAQRGKTIAQTVQDALSLDLWVEAQMQAGNKILVEQPDGKVYTAIKPAHGSRRRA